MTKQIDFYFDFASPNAYLSNKVMKDVVERTGATINYIPVLLGGIFKLTNNQPPMMAFAGILNKNEYQSLEMTRFMMTLKDAVDLVLFAFQKGNPGDIFVQKSPSITIGILAKTMKKIYNSSIEIKNIGIRHAEKIHETLLSREEKMVAEDLGDYFRVSADNRDLNYNKYFSEGNEGKVNLQEYNSDNTNRLSEQELIQLLASIGYSGNN